MLINDLHFLTILQYSDADGLKRADVPLLQQLLCLWLQEQDSDQNFLREELSKMGISDFETFYLVALKLSCDVQYLAAGFDLVEENDYFLWANVIDVEHILWRAYVQTEPFFLVL